MSTKSWIQKVTNRQSKLDLLKVLTMNLHTGICITALQDYRQWFVPEMDEDPVLDPLVTEEILSEIDDAISDLRLITAGLTSVEEPLWKRLGGESLWSDHLEFPRSEWYDQVTSRLTNHGYWDWVAQQIDMSIDDEEFYFSKKK